jgi:hypothetical protein
MIYSSARTVFPNKATSDAMQDEEKGDFFAAVVDTHGR